MTTTDDEDYMNWWRYNGEMSDCEVEYPAWKAGRAFQHSFEKNNLSVSITPELLEALLGAFETNVRDCEEWVQYRNARAVLTKVK